MALLRATAEMSVQLLALGHIAHMLHSREVQEYIIDSTKT